MTGVSTPAVVDEVVLAGGTWTAQELGDVIGKSREYARRELRRLHGASLILALPRASTQEPQRYAPVVERPLVPADTLLLPPTPAVPGPPRLVAHALARRLPRDLPRPRITGAVNDLTIRGFLENVRDGAAQTELRIRRGGIDDASISWMEATAANLLQIIRKARENTATAK